QPGHLELEKLLSPGLALEQRPRRRSLNRAQTQAPVTLVRKSLELRAGPESSAPNQKSVTQAGCCPQERCPISRTGTSSSLRLAQPRWTQPQAERRVRGEKFCGS